MSPVPSPRVARNPWWKLIDWRLVAAVGLPLWAFVFGLLVPLKSHTAVVEAPPEHPPAVAAPEDDSIPPPREIRYREAELDDEARRKLVDYSLILFERLGCRDYARFDFRCDAEGTPKLLEVNPNPGWCWDGKMNLMAGFGGLSYADMLRMIIDAGQARCAAQRAEAARVAAE